MEIVISKSKKPGKKVDARIGNKRNGFIWRKRGFRCYTT